MKKKEKAKTISSLVEMLERERGYSLSFCKEIWALKEKFYGPFTRDQQLKELAVKFGQFLVVMNVKSVEYSHEGAKTYKTNMGMAPDMLTESMEAMFDRFIQSEAHWPKQENSEPITITKQ